MAITRIKNNQITDVTIVGSEKLVNKSVTSGKLEDNLTYGSNLTVTGNLTVNGSTTTVNSTTVTVDDPILLLAPDATGSGALDLGFIGERGDDTNVAFVWDESEDEFAVAFTSSADSSTTLTITDYADLRAGNAAFDDNVTIGGTLGVTGAVTLSDDISAVNITASGTLDVTGLSSLDGGIDVNGGNFTVGTDGGIYSADTLDVDGAATLGSTLAVTGATTLTGLLNANGGIAVDSTNFTVDGTTGAVVTASTLDVAGLASLDGGIDVDGAFTVADTSGNISTTGTLNVDGASTLNSVTLDAASTFNAGGNKLTNLADPTNAQDAATKAYVDAELSAGWILSDGVTSQTIDVSSSDTLTVSGTANEITATVSATDTLTIGLPDDVTIGNDLTVTTNTSLGGTLDVAGATNFNDTTASSSNTTGAVVIDGGLGLAGNLNMGGNIDVDGTANVTGQTDLGAALNVTGLASLDGGIDVDGAFTVADTNGNVSTTGTLNVDGATTLADVTIDAASTIDMGANKVTNVADPTVDQDAATKKYVDDEVTAASQFDIAGDTGTDTVTVGTDTLTFSGTANEIVTAVTDNEVTISLPNDVTIGNNLTVTGDLTVNGTTTTVNSTTVTIDDPVYTIGTNTVDDNKDRGTEFKYNDGTAKIGFFGYDDSTGNFTALVGATNTGEVFSGTAAPATFGDLTVTDTGITGTLDVSGLASLDGGIDVDGAFTVADSTGNVSTTGTLAAGNTDITGTLDVSGLASLDGGIDVDGAFTVADGSGNVDTSGTLNVDGNATFNGNVTLGDAATDSVTITADISSNMIPGADSTYDIGDNTDRWANIYVDAATVTDNVTVGGTLGVTGETTLASATVSDLTDNRIVIAGLAGALEDDANLTFDGTTFEVGTAFDVVAASGNTNIAGTLDVAGVASLDGGIDVDGAFTVANTSGNISTSGTLTVTGATVLNGGLTMDTTAFTVADTSGNVHTDGTLDVDGATTLNSTLGVTGESTLASATVSDLTDNRIVIAGTNGSLEDDGNFTFNGTTFQVGTNGSGFDVTVANGNTNIDGTLTVDGASTQTGNVSMGGTLGVSGATTLSSTLDVTGNATFNGNVDLQDNDTLNIGTGDDFSIVHDGSTTAISNDTGILSIDGAAGSAIRVNEAGADVDFIVEGDTVATLFKVDAGTDTVVIGSGTATAGASLAVDTTDSFLIAKGTTAQRPATGAQGMMRYNTTSNGLEYYDGSEWKNMTAEFTVIVADSFNGDGSTVAFTLTNSGTTATTVVSINGVVQLPNTAYAVSGTTLTFTEAPASGDVIDARSLTTTSSVTGIDDGSGTSTIDANGDGTIDIVGDVQLSAQGDLRFMDSDSSNYVAFQAPGTVSSNVTWTLPSADAGTSGYALVSDGAGTLSWAAAGATISQDNATNTAFNLYYAATTSGALTAVKYDGGTLTFNPSTETLAISNVSATTVTTSGNATIGGALTVTGDLTVNGTTTTINSTTMTVDDLNIVLASGAATAAAANGAGITVDGASATITYASTGDKWVFNKDGDFGANDVTATNFNGIASSAKYADLAEKYGVVEDIEPGTVVCFGGDAEVQVCDHDMDRKVAGVVSTDPAYMMNSEAENAVYVALTGRVPCKVVGPVRKGDMMVSAGNGAARAEENPVLGSVIGKALEDFDGAEGVIEVVVGRL